MRGLGTATSQDSWLSLAKAQAVLGCASHPHQGPSEDQAAHTWERARVQTSVGDGVFVSGCELC